MTTGIFGAFPDAVRTVNGRPRKIARPLPRPRNARLHTPLFAAILLLAACNTTRWVPPGERLLVRNTITAGPKGTLTADELEPIIKQKPNKRVLGRAIYLDLYNLRDPGKVARKRALKDSLCEAENAARQLMDSSRVKECTASQRGRNGEAPVLLDSSLVQRTVEQLRNYAFKEGYFAAQVSDTVRYVRRRWPFGGWGRPYKKPKANVQYVVQAGRPWTFCTINLRVDDPSIAGYLRADSAGTLLHPGGRFDGDALEAERARITNVLKKEGFLFFTKDMVLFDADTAAGDHEVDLLIRLERPLASTQRGLKGTPPGTVWYVNDVYIDAARRTGNALTLAYDTVLYDGYTLLHKGRRPTFRPGPITNAILLRPYSRFNQNDADRTFRRLANMGVFDRVDITYDTAGRGLGNVDARVTLIPSRRQGFSVEGFLTNRGGFLGASGSLNYRHKNLFRTLTSLQASITVGMEAQQSLTPDNADGDASTSLTRDAILNTLEIGPELKVFVPIRGGSAMAGGSRGVVNALFNYQRRPDYTRTLAKGAIGYEWNFSFISACAVYFPEVNVVRIPERSAAFEDFLLESTDPVLTNSYTDHIIVNLPRVTWTYNTANAPGPARRNNQFVRANVELAGTILRFVQDLSGARRMDDTISLDSYYTIDKVRYAEYIKADLDLRHYHTIHDRSSIVFRFAPGFAKPFGNQHVMPFETSFYSGGANGIRAWRARSLGPGGYRSGVNNFDRIGELRLEANLEYRFKLIGYFEGALFADGGNIWYLQDNPAKPGSRFKWGEFYNQIALGTGLGLRLNFDFLLLRLDLALQTHDPSLPAGQRWIIQPRSDEYDAPFGQRLNFNLGIGYPF